MNLLTAADLPDRFATVPDLEELLTRPSEALIEDLLVTPGDIAIIGVAGRLGPLLARLARRAAPDRRIVGVSQFADAYQARALQSYGIEPIACDMLDAGAIAALPQVANVIFMAGRRATASDHPSFAWAMNTYLPALIARQYRDSRIVAFSTSEIYPAGEIGAGGSGERAIPVPAGEYAQSCLGRERLFEHFSRVHGTPGRILRIGTPVEVRHGLLFDIAARIFGGEPVDVGAGHVNVIWQGDLAAIALRALRQATAPTAPINVSGPEILQVRWVAEQFGHRFGRAPILTGTEPTLTRLGNPAAANAMFGYPLVPVARMLDWVADWVARGLPHFGKPAPIESADAERRGS